MTSINGLPLVSTIRERCRVCYTCVRECPAKAIRIEGGQAEVISSKCIGCGNCVRVCSQGAKQVASSLETVSRLLESGEVVCACLAPSFPAEFVDVDYTILIGMLRQVGFQRVHEVAFGADLVAERYRRCLQNHSAARFIAANCPAVVEYICRYHPHLVDFLVPVVSPMIATVRALKRMFGRDLKTVFIGPCIAKKAEADPRQPLPEVDAVMTYVELRQLFEAKNIRPAEAAASEFDPPHSRSGSLFPVSRGMLEAADISDDLLAGNVLAADGKVDFVEAIKEFESGDLVVRLLEVLCCSGCIMGPGIGSRLPLFSRRARVLQYVRRRLEVVPEGQWEAQMARCADLDLSRSFVINDQRLPPPPVEALQCILNRMGKFSPADELNCGACGYDTCREHAVAIYRGSAENEMCLPYNIDQLRKTLKDLAVSNETLARVQEALIQSEKLASMGQLAAGIAHEINNPLGIVLMYAHLMSDAYGHDIRLRGDLDMIVDQTDRCKKIVAGLLNFARQNQVLRQPTHIGKLIDHVAKTIQLPPDVRLRVVHRAIQTMAEIDADQITQVLNNLVQNAVEACPSGGEVNLAVSDAGSDRIFFTVSDTGNGIAPECIAKVFEPFFTTKKLGKGTGLGLAVAYGIVKMHRGEIDVVSNCDPAAGPTGTTFTVNLPRQEQTERTGDGTT